MPPVHIAAYDGSAAASAALDFAATFAVGAGADLIAAYVYAPAFPVLGSSGARAIEARLNAEERTEAEALVLGASRPGITTRAIRESSPARALHRLAEREGAELIVIGRTHHGAARRATHTGILERLLHGAPCSLLVVAPDPPGAIRTVGVAFDGRREADGVLAAGAVLAERLGAQLVVMGVAEPLATVGTGAVPASRWTLERSYPDAVRLRLQEAVDGLGGAAAQLRVGNGPAAPTLVAACADGIDLLVAGSRAYGPLRSVLAGSVSHHLAHEAPCPVLIVPRGCAGSPA